jgi:hypothetical protein
MPMWVGMEEYRPATEHAVDPFLARAALERLSERVRDALICSAAAALLGVVLMLAGELRFGFPPLLGAVAGTLVAAIARADRQALVARLMRQRSAYAIDEVAAAAEGLATPEARLLAARSLGRLVLEADGLIPANPAHAERHARVQACRSELIAIAFELTRADTRVHPTALLLLQRVLSVPSSPLYRPDSSGATLRATLRRVEAGLERDD